MFKRLLILCAALACAFAPAVFAKDVSPLSVRTVHQTTQGIDRIFSFTIANSLDHDVSVNGRVVVINVYDTSLPTSLPVERISVPAHGSSDVTVRWHDAPIFGQIRVSVVLDEGVDSLLVQSYAFWLLPNPVAAAAFAIALALAVLAVIVVTRFVHHAQGPKTPAAKPGKQKKPATPFFKTRVPSNMLAYRVELDDTIMSLSSRFDVTWQDLVRDNRLKPPYALVPGKIIQIPRHALKTRPAPPQA